MELLARDSLRIVHVEDTWRDINGPIGLLLDSVFCSFVFLLALGMMPFALLILLADYVISPVWRFIEQTASYRPM
jgi:hypothetical protein